MKDVTPPVQREGSEPPVPPSKFTFTDCWNAAVAYGPEAVSLFNKLADLAVIQEQEQTKRELIAVERDVALNHISKGAKTTRMLVGKEYERRAEFQRDYAALMKRHCK